MPTVVIVHAAEDAMPARALAVKLRAARLSPVFEQFGEPLRQSIQDAALTLALWSPRSILQPDLVADMGYAKSCGPVLHACMQNAVAPEIFHRDRAFDLTGWRGEDNFQAWIDLLAAITALAGVEAPAPPAPRAAAGAFFRPGSPAAGAAAPPPPARQEPPPRPQPRPQPHLAAVPPPPPDLRPPDALYDDARGGGLPVVPILIAVLVLALGAGGYMFFTGRQSADTLATAWDNTARNDAAALRAFLSDNPGRFRADAETALATLEEQSFDAAQEEDTIEGFEAFLNDFPDSDHAIEARGRIAELQTLPEDEPPPPDELVPFDPVDPALAEPDPALAPPEPDPSSGPVTLTPPPAPEPTPEELPEPAGANDEPIELGPTN